MEKNKIYTIYCHINKINGKRYIGKTSQTLERRGGKNGIGYKECTNFYNAILEYGWDNFEHNIIATTDDSEEANFLEEVYIKIYKTTDSEFGYNLQSGGDCYKHSESTKLKISLNHADVSCENNPMYGVHRYGEEAPMYGKKHSNAAKQKISEAMTGKYIGENNPRARSVICVETGQLFLTAKEAGEWAGSKSIHPGTSIIACCRNIRKNAFGYTWEYADNF